MISEHGRKFFATVTGMGVVAALSVVGMLLKVDADYMSAAATSIGGMVAAFCAANAVGDLAHRGQHASSAPQASGDGA